MVLNPVLKHSKIISILYQNQKTKDRITLRQQERSKMTFLAVEKHSDIISKKMKNYRRIADEIILNQKLINSTSIDSYMLSATGIKTSAYNKDYKDRKRKC